MAHRNSYRNQVTPLSDLRPEMRAEIEAAVARDTPPPRWKYFGPPGSPRPLAAMESRAWLEWRWARGLGINNRSKIPARIREAVLARDGLICQLCNEPVEPDDVHLDHIHPVSKGGQDTISNLQVTHSRCNIRKGARV